eukprot:CAMPEP_0167786144 /NCGR_PEP_ID=MMETSP0111_2-20121227/8616_1 /TAXON_ID=91324 /ORGANISM="Lotharella globosa, Strain CCCM811" /LENGTH=122 /DNA_ID=CAMNT_0007677467 /DNA_START=344 /DNA_END=709 /DNA_ORIENTATION=+
MADGGPISCFALGSEEADGRVKTPLVTVAGDLDFFLASASSCLYFSQFSFFLVALDLWRPFCLASFFSMAAARFLRSSSAVPWPDEAGDLGFPFASVFPPPTAPPPMLSLFPMGPSLRSGSV